MESKSKLGSIANHTYKNKRCFQSRRSKQSRMILAELSIADRQHDLIHEQRAEFNILVGAALFERPQDLKLGVFLADPPVGHEPNSRAHFFSSSPGCTNFQQIDEGMNI